MLVEMTWFLVPLVLIALLWLAIRVQRRFIYFPRRYSALDLKEAKAVGVQEITFQTSQGNQTAFFWRKPLSEIAPDSLWLLFAGNGSVALDWIPLIVDSPEPRTGFLLIDYPGYGSCQGKPDPQSILENSERAFQALLDQTGWRLGTLRALGHSLGGAAALQFAAKHTVQKIVLISTFTTMDAMVRATIGITLGPLLRHPFDNVRSLKAILSRKPVPEICIFHGEADELIPPRMGRALAQLDPSRIEFVSIAGADHNELIEEALWTVLRT
jgi:uncharacterized protein